MHSGGTADFARVVKRKADLMGDMTVGPIVANAGIEQRPTDAKEHRSRP
jgi:hypothetical protein